MQPQTFTIRIKSRKAYNTLRNLEEENLIEMVEEPVSEYKAKKVIRKAEKSKSVPLIEAKAISETWKKSR